MLAFAKPRIRAISLFLGLCGLVAGTTRADSMPLFRDLGQDVTGLTMNDAGTIAGLRYDPHGLQYVPGPSGGLYSPFMDRNGSVTALAPNINPVHVTATGGVINGNDALGGNLHTGYAGYYSQGDGVPINVSPPIAANDSGQMIGTASYQIQSVNLGAPSDVYRQAGYLYTPFPASTTPFYGYGPPGSGPNATTFGTVQLYPYSVPQEDVPGLKAQYLYAINNAGTVAGSQLVETQTTVNGKTQDVFTSTAIVGGKDISGQVGTNSVASALNEKGDAAGIAGNNAFLYKDGQATILPGVVGYYGSWLSVHGMNAQDFVVGSVGLHAVVWRPTSGQTLDLNSLLPANSGWLLTDALQINDSGIILGEGIYDGREHGFVLNLNAVPEPSTLALLTLASVGIASIRARGRRRASR